MRAFWDQDRGGRNFGDALTAVLLERLAGVEVEWSEPESADLFGVGSSAEAIPPGFSGIVLGTGKMFSSSALDLRAARVLALRGALTAEGSRADCPLLADLGLLASDLAPAVEPDIEVAAMPHYVDDRTWDMPRINVLAGVDEVIRLASRCRRIVSSSLHGLVLADALGIPSLWEPHGGVAGEGYKFRDYASAYGETIRPGVWRMADPDVVERKRVELRSAVASLASESVVAA